MSLALVALIFPIFIYFDARKKRIADNDPEIDYSYNERSTSMILGFTPFVALFYADEFWVSILKIVVLYIYFAALMYLSSKKSWSPFTKADMFMYSNSGFIVVIISYFIWFHKGIAAPDTSNIKGVSTAIPVEQSVWPYYVFAAFVLAPIVSALYTRINSRSTRNIGSSLLPLSAITCPLLPLFIVHYWWGLLASFICMIFMIPFVNAQLPESSRGGIGFVVGYVFMMTATLSIILYAIIF